MRELTVGSLFSGIGGLELGLEQTGGFRTVWQVEIDPSCSQLLERHWPGVPRHDDIRTFPADRFDRPQVLCGGDPCPKHSRARGRHPSRHPDLSGYFLAVVGRLRPQWVVRENVPAPTVEHVAAALAALGYGPVVVRIDAAEATGQSRQRDFIVGRYQTPGLELRRTVFSACCDGPGPYTTKLGTRPVVPALLTNRTRHNTRDCYIVEIGPERIRGLRILESSEREVLAGFPLGWTAGFSLAVRARMLGNAVVPACARWIGERILEAEALT